jgi:hypothetical protein
MIQTWIIRDDVHPVVASRTGADSAICGDCPHRGQYDAIGNRVAGTRTCYVMLTPVASVYRTLRNNRYDDLSASLDVAADRIAGSMLRLGSYGDPAAIPHDVWTALLAGVAGHTGYTHQWRAFPEYADILMASCDSVAERVQARVWVSGHSASHPRQGGPKSIAKRCALPRNRRARRRHVPSAGHAAARHRARGAIS